MSCADEIFGTHRAAITTTLGQADGSAGARCHRSGHDCQACSVVPGRSMRFGAGLVTT